MVAILAKAQFLELAQSPIYFFFFFKVLRIEVLLGKSKRP